MASLVNGEKYLPCHFIKDGMNHNLKVLFLLSVEGSLVSLPAIFVNFSEADV